MNECVEGEEIAKRRKERDEAGVGLWGRGWLMREASKLKKFQKMDGFFGSQGPLGINSRLKKCNFGNAPVCMPIEPFIVWDSLGQSSFIHFLCRRRDSVLMVKSKVSHLIFICRVAIELQHFCESVKWI